MISSLRYFTNNVWKPYILLSTSIRAISRQASERVRHLKNIHTPRRKFSSMTSEKIKTASRIKGLDKNIWVQMVALNMQYKPVNVGQGFPDYSPPEYLKEALVSATTSQNDLMNQYTRSQGHPRLVKSISSLFSKLHGRDINPMTQVLVTNGAYESLFCAICAFVNEGDEVIIIEPFFDCYEKMIQFCGGVPVGVPLRPSKDCESSAGWKLDPIELEAAFSPKTKAIIFNTPNNPLGKVFQRSEIEMIADLVKKHNVLCISDEVYEWLVYPGNEHIRIATLPGMWDHTLTISSAGKTFSVTGWKIGWTIGPEELITALQSVHANAMYVLCTPTQEAVAIGLEREEKLLGTEKSYFHEMTTSLLKKRDFTLKILREAGFKPVCPEGGYFIMADASKFDMSFSDDQSDDSVSMKICKWMMTEKKDSTLKMLDDTLKSQMGVV